MVKNLVLFVILGLLAINTVSGRKCYQCDECGDSLNEDQLKVCKDDPFNPTVAPPTTTPGKETTNKDDGKAIYLNKYNRDGEAEDNDFRCVKYTKDDKDYRSCTKSQCKSIEKDETIKQCYLCTEDACNFGTNIQSWAFSSIILVAIAKYLM